MQTEINKTEIKAKIATLRQNYLRLRTICGPQGINKETIAEYADKIRELEEQLN